MPDAAPGGTPPEPAPSGNRWLAPNSELVPQFTTEGVSEQQAGPVKTAAACIDEVPVRDGQLRAPRRWERLLVEAAVIGGRDRWRRRIEGLANELRLRLSELAEEDETQAATLSRTLDDLAAFAGYAIPLIDVLDSLPTAANWSEWLDQLSALATRALKRPDRVLAVLAELAPMGPVGPVALNEVLLVLKRILLEVAFPPPSQRYGKVLAAPIGAARGLSFEAVFVPGLAEKMFPRKIVEEPILLDALREQIDGGLVTNQSRLEAERLAIHLQPVRPSAEFVSPIPVSTSTRRGPVSPLSTPLKPCALRRVCCPTLPSSHDEPRQRPPLGSAGRPRLTLPMPSTKPSTISPYWTALRSDRERAPVRRDIWSPSIRISPERCEPGTNAGADRGQLATGCSVVVACT